MLFNQKQREMFIAQNELLRKIHVLGVIREYGKERALRLYPELEVFILFYADKPYEQAKAEVLSQTKV
jgi:hypothetical protein